MIASTWPMLLPMPASIPSLASSRRWCWARYAAVTTLAAAETARSSDSSVCEARRTSSTTVVRSCHGISSWRTISSSWRAVDGQCTRRRSSPTTYSRQRVELVALAADRAVVHDVAERIAVAAARWRGDHVDVGEHGELEPGSAWPPVAGEAERVGDLHRERADGHDAAPLGREPVRGPRPLGVAERHEVQAGASGAGDRVAQGRAPACGRSPMFVAVTSTRAASPACTRAGVSVRRTRRWVGTART